MSFTKSLQEFLELLETMQPSEFAKLMNKIQLHPKDFKKYESWKDKGYTRNCVKRSTSFELVLLCWNPGDATSIHDHNGQKCWVYQLEGSVTEKRYKKKGDFLKEISSSSVDPGGVTYMDDKMGYHSLLNEGTEKALTLHLYMSPIDSCDYFCEQEKVFKNKTLQYDTAY